MNLVVPAAKQLAGIAHAFNRRPNGSPLETVDCESNYPLGVVEDATFPAISVDTGDDPYVFFTYTDGVIEAMNAQGEQFGMERLHAVLEAHTDLNPHTCRIDHGQSTGCRSGDDRGGERSQ